MNNNKQHKEEKVSNGLEKSALASNLTPPSENYNFGKANSFDGKSGEVQSMPESLSSSKQVNKHPQNPNHVAGTQQSGRNGHLQHPQMNNLGYKAQQYPSNSAYNSFKTKQKGNG